MKRALVAILLGCMTLGIPSLVLAFDNDQAAIVAHVTPSGSLVCTPGAQGGGMGLTSADIVTAVNDGSGCNDGIPGGARWDVWLLVCNGSDSTGIRGAEFGIEYNPDPYGGIYVNGWDRCADLDFQEPAWSSPGATSPAGILVTWTPENCQIENSEPYVPRTVIAVMGALDVFTYSPDILQIIPRPISGRAEVADCAGAQQSILGGIVSHLGYSEWCLGAGYSPCGVVTPVTPTTWGRLKQFGGE